VLPTRYTRFGAVLTTNPSTGRLAASIPALRLSSQSPITMAARSGGGGSATTASLAPVLRRTTSTSSSTSRLSTGGLWPRLFGTNGSLPAASAT